MKDIETYFPALTALQKQQFDALPDLYADWNAKINVISRKDIGNLALHHVLHSLAIAKYISFAPGTHIMDVGTGGGFPGIPLAVFFPDVHFLLLDSIGKKIKVADAVAKEIGLSNVEVARARGERKEKISFYCEQGSHAVAGTHQDHTQKYRCRTDKRPSQWYHLFKGR